MKLIIITLCVLFSLDSFAQNKVTPAATSTLTAISLPEGSKQDKRNLYVGAAKYLLETVSKKKGTGITNTEVLYLPLGYTLDALKTMLQNANWVISPVDGEPDYLWLQQDNKQVLAHFSIDKKNGNLYFGSIKQTVSPTVDANNAPPIISTKTEIKQEPLPENVPAVPVAGNGFAFTTTNFDDGWISTVQENWVEVTKGSIKVLIHYPNAKADAYNSVLKEADYTAWNTLVAPRYSNMSNFEWKTIQSWQSISFVQADATENASGKNVHIVLFKKHYSNGNGAYLEFVTDTKADYENEFGPYHNTEFNWDKTANMQFRNKFAIAATDFTGKWTNDFTGMQQYVNAHTGADAGMSSYSSKQIFEFGAGNTYHWEITVGSGMVGNIKFRQVKSKGVFAALSNWQLKFSDMEGKPRTYNAFFSCIKGARVLWLDDTGFAKMD